jgi:hypothetical protein
VKAASLVGSFEWLGADTVVSSATPKRRAFYSRFFDEQGIAKSADTCSRIPFESQGARARGRCEKREAK